MPKSAPHESTIQRSRERVSSETPSETLLWLITWKGYCVITDDKQRDDERQSFRFDFIFFFFSTVVLRGHARNVQQRSLRGNVNAGNSKFHDPTPCVFVFSVRDVIVVMPDGVHATLTLSLLLLPLFSRFFFGRAPIVNTAYYRWPVLHRLELFLRP